LSCGDKVKAKASQFLLPKSVFGIFYIDPVRWGPVDGTAYIEQS